MVGYGGGSIAKQTMCLHAVMIFMAREKYLLYCIEEEERVYRS